MLCLYNTDWLVPFMIKKKKQFHFIKLDFKDMQEMNTNI